MLVTGNYGYGSSNLGTEAYRPTKDRTAPSLVEKSVATKENKKPAQTQTSASHKRDVEKLADSISSIQLYTKEASSAIAENLLAYQVKYLA